MVRRSASILAVAVALVACQAKAPGTSSRPKPTAANPALGPSPSASPATGASRSADPAATAATLAASPKPLVPVAFLSGSVRVDAAYVLGQGQGQLVGSGEGRTLKVKGLGSGNLAAGFAPAELAGLVGDHGGSLIGNNGGALLSNNGAGLLANNGGGLVGNNGAAWRLRAFGALGFVPAGVGPWGEAPTRALAQAERAASLALGQQLPAEGLAVRAFDLGSGEALPLVGAAGEALGAVLTGADGTYRLRFAQAPLNRVLVAVELPGAKDARLALRALGQATPQAEATASQAVPVDEERNAALAFVRLSFQGQLAGALTLASLDQLDLTTWRVPEAARAQLTAALTLLRADAQAVGMGALPLAQQRAVAAGAADAILGTIDLEALALDPAMSQTWKGGKEPMLPAVQAILRFTSEVAAKRLGADPQAFAQDADLVAYNASRPGVAPFQILRPADFNAFLVEAFLATNLDPTKRAGVFLSRHNGGSQADPLTGLDQMARMRAAADALTQAVGLALLATDGPARPAAAGRMRADVGRLKPVSAPESTATP